MQMKQLQLKVQSCLPSSTRTCAVPHLLSKQPNLLTAYRCTRCRTEHPSASSVAPTHRWSGCRTCEYSRQHGHYDCSLDMKQDTRVLRLVVRRWCVGYQGSLQARASCDHSDKDGFDYAFRKDDPEATKEHASSGSRTSASSCVAERSM